MIAAGVFSVLPTPFGPSGDFDPDSLTRVIDLFLADGVNGFTALGVTSEVARMTESERDRVLDAVLAHVNGRVPVVAGQTPVACGRSARPRGGGPRPAPRRGVIRRRG